MAYRRVPGGGWVGGLEPDTNPELSMRGGGVGITGGRIRTPEEQAAEQAQLRADLAQMGLDPTTLDRGLAPGQKELTREVVGGDMHNPGWGIERPGEPLTAMTPEEALAHFRPSGVDDALREQMRAELMTRGVPSPVAAGGGYPVAPLPPPVWSAGGVSGTGPAPTLGGAAGMGQTPPWTSFGSGGGQAQTSGLQSMSGYGGGSPMGMYGGSTPYSMNRQSAVGGYSAGGARQNAAGAYGPRQNAVGAYGQRQNAAGGGWSTLGAFGFGRR